MKADPAISANDFRRAAIESWTALRLPWGFSSPTATTSPVFDDYAILV